MSFSAFTGGVLLPGIVVLGLALIPFLDREKEPSGVWFSGAKGKRVFLWSVLVSSIVVIGVEFIAIRFGWLRTWFPNIHQMWIVIINPGTVMAVLLALWSQWVLRRTGSTRMSAIALFTSILVGFLILTYIATFLRGPNWNFYWSESQWPVH